MARPELLVTRHTLLPTREGMEHWTISIDRATSPYYEGERWVVRWMGSCVCLDGTMIDEPQPSSRTDEFYRQTRFTCLGLATKAVEHVAARLKVNRHWVYDYGQEAKEGA